MPPKLTQSSRPSSFNPKPPRKAKASKATTVKLDAAPLNLQRINPLTAFSNTPPSATADATRKASQPSQKSKGKEKEACTSTPVDRSDDCLWVDIYEPTTEAELAVHVKKVQDVRRWLDEALVGGSGGKLRKYRRILALTGPAGTAKTATIRVLAREMDCEILEWRNAIGETSLNRFGDDPQSYDPDHESLISKFEAFMTRASTCKNLFAGAQAPEKNAKSTPLSSSSSSSSSRSSPRKRQILLLEDLPNILHTSTQARFHAALQALVAAPSASPVPIVVIVSDAGMRGEASDERLASGAWGKDRDGVLDIRTVLPKDLLYGPYVTQIGFNPIAPTLMKKALQSLITTHFSSKPSGSAPSKETLDIIIETSNGDIRSAIMALQFSCVVVASGAKTRKKQSGSSAKVVLAAITRREQSLELFHLIGRVLYNKRKGDPPNPSATAKDIQKDKELDATLKDPPKLPSFLADHARRTSRVNVDSLYANSPIDSSLFSLYIHQNYTQYCNETEECEGVAEWLSWIDSSGGEAWYQANPHRFHLLTLGTLHSLPTPVPRRSQKVFKPEFFDFLTKEKDAWDAVRDVRGWIAEDAVLKEANSWRLGGWSRAEVATELGGVLKARDAKQTRAKAPASHRLFTNMPFVSGGEHRGLRQLGEGETSSDTVDILEDDGGPRGGWSELADMQSGGWLENDDIEEF
ncbi:Rad17 cell cycle checkpoint protein-domain-containing protein [Mycena belliarum]|uniref:Rad17 cell cycle checkpoint protein-domain-containing protein n=1 Tax=Mycena belliarum TaxID=1033014 RepID=A0AAD6U3N8_9AGAR|nr:Rad17 cell cycle checkpoint protein-domain-containing protein [Mycena belliae]